MPTTTARISLFLDLGFKLPKILQELQDSQGLPTQATMACHPCKEAELLLRHGDPISKVTPPKSQRNLETWSRNEVVKVWPPPSEADKT